MSDLYPNLGRDGQILDIAAAADVLVDGGVVADRVSMYTNPEPTGVLGDEFNFRAHNRTPPPAPKKEKKNKGGRKKSKVSRRLTKRKKTRKHKKTRRHRGGMFPSNAIWVQLKDNIFFPPHGYSETGKSEEYLRLSNSIMWSIVNEHFSNLLDILSNAKNKNVYFTDLSNIGGEIRQQRMTPPLPLSTRTPSPVPIGTRPVTPRPGSVEPGPGGYDLVKHVIMPQVLSGSQNMDNMFVNISKTDLTPEQQGNILSKKTFSSEVTLETKSIPGMPGGARQKYGYEIIVYTQTSQIKTVCITINEDIGGRMETVTYHGVDDLLLWVLFKIAIIASNTLGATIITNDNMRFIPSGSEIDKELYKEYNSQIREKIQLDNKQNLIVSA
tara:strand:- start:2103 stop:3251 length:1149 start_codon:yes stop_codon:yes gene_type:complete